MEETNTTRADHYSKERASREEKAPHRAKSITRQGRGPQEKLQDRAGKACFGAMKTLHRKSGTSTKQPSGMKRATLLTTDLGSGTNEQEQHSSNGKAKTELEVLWMIQSALNREF